MKQIVLGALAALSVYLSSYLFSSALKFRYTHGDVITVTGSAEENFESDLVVWQGSFVRNSSNLKTAYASLKDDADKIQKYLTSKGLPQKEVVFSAISTSEIYDDKFNAEGKQIGREFKGYSLMQSVKVESADVDKVEAVSRESTELIEAGVEFKSQAPAFYFTKLAELKVGLVGRAAGDARQRAETVLKNTGGKLGHLRQSSVGIFQIVGRHSGDAYTSSGAYNTADRAKSGQVTVKVEFAID